FSRRLVALDPAASQNPAAWQKLAALELDSLDLAAATRTWQMLVARFPRDPGALAQAEDFFANVADDPAQALELLRRIVALEPADLARQLRLGRLKLLAAGDVNAHRAAARRAFEEILARTEPVTFSSHAGDSSNAALLLPQPRSSYRSAGQQLFHSKSGVARLAEPVAAPPQRIIDRRGPRPPAAAGTASSGATADSSDARLRLLAIGELSSMLCREETSSGRLREDEARHAWLERWRADSERTPLEAFWAFYYLGENALALDVCEKSLLPARSADAPQLTSAFLDLIYEAGDAPRLARWLREAPASAADFDTLARRRTLACEALARYVPEVVTDRLDPALLDAVFPPDASSADGVPREKLWQIATQVLAPAGRLAEAVRLGERVFAGSVTGRAACGLQLARWHLLLRQPERALAILAAAGERDDASLDSSDLMPVSDNADAAWSNECLRVFFYLLPPAEREPFRERFAPRERSSAQTLLSRVLLDGLQGEWPAGRRHLDELIAQRPLSDRPEIGSDGSAELRRWSYWQETGNRLDGWNLSPLAAHLWRAILADPGKAGLNNDPLVHLLALQEVRLRLAASELETAEGDPVKIERALQPLLDSDPTPDILGVLRDRLRNVTARLGTPAGIAAHVRVAELVCAREFSAENVRALLTIYAQAGDPDASERLLRRCFFANPESRATSPGLPRTETAQRLAEILEAAGDLP
ncbi:MAG: hypothetical protein JO117_03585, partial [Verrucomicrobia bacterium]|nr:hypothetical protein [Verrucomicrobiota bacterium]